MSKEPSLTPQQVSQLQLMPSRQRHKALLRLGLSRKEVRLLMRKYGI
jgi:hypothetical protein